MVQSISAHIPFLHCQSCFRLQTPHAYTCQTHCFRMPKYFFYDPDSTRATSFRSPNPRGLKLLELFFYMPAQAKVNDFRCQCMSFRLQTPHAYRNQKIIYYLHRRRITLQAPSETCQTTETRRAPHHYLHVCTTQGRLSISMGGTANIAALSPVWQLLLPLSKPRGKLR